MSEIMWAGDEQLIILRPSQPNHVYREFVHSYLDEGIYFPMDGEDQLPDTLPADLSQVRCLVMDQETRAALEAGPQASLLKSFLVEGGYIHVPDLKTPTGGALGYLTAMHNVQRAICTAGLTHRHPSMRQRLLARNEADWLNIWKAAAETELKQYAAMGHCFGDPVGFVTLRACDEAAAYFEEPGFLAPGDAFMQEHFASYGQGRGEQTGGRYLLRFARRHNLPQVTEHVVAEAKRKSLWRFQGVYLNMDLEVPEGMDPDSPPYRVQANAWTWPETAGKIGDTWAAISRETGDPTWSQRAVEHVLKAYPWLYNPANGLIMHVGRPDGPDLRSVPWGRGITWFLCALRGLLDDLPAEHPARPRLQAMLGQILDGLLRYQDDWGLWHNVVDAAPADSRPCASATSRILQIYARAYHRGWLRDPRIPDMVEKAWQGLKTKVWQGGLIACCVGTSYGLSRQTYLARPHHTFRTSRSEMLIDWIERQRMLGV